MICLKTNAALFLIVVDVCYVLHYFLLYESLFTHKTQPVKV